MGFKAGRRFRAEGCGCALHRASQFSPSFSDLAGGLELLLQGRLFKLGLDDFELSDHAFDCEAQMIGVGQAYIAPDAIRTFSEARHVAKPGGCKFERKRTFRGDSSGKCGRKQLRQMAEISESAIVSFGVRLEGAPVQAASKRSVCSQTASTPRIQCSTFPCPRADVRR